MTDETRAALETVSDLRRRGLIHQQPPTPQPDLPSLADHATDRQAFLACIQPRALHVVTMGIAGADTPPCSARYDCTCERCELEREQSIRRQRAAADPYPVKRRLAA